MKYRKIEKIFLLSIVFMANHLFAQESFFDFKKHPEKKHQELFSPGKKIKGTSPIHGIFKNFKMTAAKNNHDARLLSSLPNGTRIFSLPQDNMICLVPDLKQFNMPNPVNGMKISGMPPGSSDGKKLIPQDEGNKKAPVPGGRISSKQ